MVLLKNAARGRGLGITTPILIPPRPTPGGVFLFLSNCPVHSLRRMMEHFLINPSNLV